MPTDTRPNLLFVMTDQQRFDALSSHGGQARTPHLDALAASGADLRRHYAQAPVCVPSRSSIFSGRYPHAHRVLENDARLAPHEVHLFKVLRQEGYWLGYHGKDHLLPDGEMAANAQECSQPGHDESASDERVAYQQTVREAGRRLREIGSYASAQFHDFSDDVTSTGMTANGALASLDAAPTDAPWCVVASFHDPHVPHLAPRRFAELYPADQMEIPPLPEGDPFAGKPPRLSVKYRAQGADRASDADKRHYLSVYYSMCSYIDEQVGRMLDRLAQRPDADRTVIVFTSDHGDFAWHHGMCKKDLVLYEDLLHVPMILTWPGQIEAQSVEQTFTEQIDLMPTLLEAMGLPIPFGVQGRSFLPLLRGESNRHRDEVHAEVCYPWMRNPHPTYEDFVAAWEADQRAGKSSVHVAPFNVPGDYTKGLRTAEWSYNWYGDGFEELYDLQRDPDEWHNCALDPAYADRLSEYRTRMKDWIIRDADPRSPRHEREQLRQFDRWQTTS